MAALISSVMSTKDKVPFFAARCDEMGIEILPPDVNLSDHEFIVVEGNIRFGLDAVKGVGYAAVEAIKAARETGPFESLWDFCARIDPRAVNKKAIEALVKCGAFGSTGASRKGMLSVLEQAQGAGQQAQQDLAIGQGSIFDLAPEAPAANGAAAAFAVSHPPIPAEEFDQHEMLAAEMESIGLFISAHPLKEVRDALLEKVDAPLAELHRCKDGEWATVGGIITQSKKIRTRSGTTMAFATLDDLEGTIEILMFEKTLAEYEAVLAVDEVVLVRGRVDHKDKDKTCLVVQSAEPFRPSLEQVESARDAAALRATGPEPLKVVLDASRFAPAIIDELKHVFECFPGESEVVLDLHTADGIRTLRFGPSYRVKPTASLRAELSSILGPSALVAAPVAAQAA
jgi:DNA polymerase-3 subunit alpha